MRSGERRGAIVVEPRALRSADAVGGRESSARRDRSTGGSTSTSTAHLSERWSGRLTGRLKHTKSGRRVAPVAGLPRAIGSPLSLVAGQPVHEGTMQYERDFDTWLASRFPDGKWPEYPYRSRSKRVPVDRDRARNLFDRYPAWAGNWQDFAPALSFPPSPDVHVDALCTAVRSWVEEVQERRLSMGLTCTGAGSTSAASIVQVVVVKPPAASDEENELEIIARRLVDIDESADVRDFVLALRELGGYGGEYRKGNDICEKAGMGSHRRECRNAIATAAHGLGLLVDANGKPGPNGGYSLSQNGVKVAQLVRELFDAIPPRAR